MGVINTLSWLAWLIGIFVVQFLLIIIYDFFRHGSKPISMFTLFLSSYALALYGLGYWFYSKEQFSDLLFYTMFPGLIFAAVTIFSIYKDGTNLSEFEQNLSKLVTQKLKGIWKNKKPNK
jgi:hypothetical protein